MRRIPLVLLALLTFATAASADGRNEAPVAAESRPFPEAPTATPRVVPSTIAFQGYATDTGGTPLDGTVNLDLFLYDAASGGTPLWSELQTAVPVAGGVFSIGLGDVTPLATSLFDGTALYLGIRIDGSAELTPRTELRTSPFAFKSFDSDNFGGLGPDGYVAVTGDDMTGRLGLYGGVQALEAGGVTEIVDSTTDVLVRKFYFDGTGGDGWGRDGSVVLSFNGLGETASGGSGVASVYVNSVLTSTINIGASGSRPWTYRVDLGEIVDFSDMEVAVRATSSATPVLVRDIWLDLGGASATGGNTLDAAYDEGGAGAGRTIATDAGAVDLTGAGGLDVETRIDVGIASTQNGVVNVYEDGIASPAVELTNRNDGGAVYTRDETGSRTTYLETDSSTGGGSWVGFYGDNTFQGYVTIDCNGAGSGDPIMNIRGDGGIASFDTRQTGDDYLQLPNDAISADEVLDEPGISQGRVSNNVVITETAIMQDIVTTTITIPAPGYIHLSASAQARMSGAVAGSEYISYQIDETAGGTQTTAYYYLAGWNTSTETGTHYLPIQSQRTYFKASAGTYTFRLEARDAIGSSSKNMWNPSITALYVPTSYGTVTEAANPSDVAQFDDVDYGPGGANEPGGVTAAAALVDLRDLEVRVAREEAQLAEARRRLLEAEQAQNGPEAIR